MSNNWRSRLEAIFPPIQQFSQEEADSPPLPEPEPILVVDHNPDGAKECAFALRAIGFDPYIAGSADEAHALFLARPVAIAIIDCGIPGGDGIALSYALMQLAETQGRKLHFIMVSGHATKDLAICAMRASATDFLEKPIRQADLRQALQRIKGLSEMPAAREVLLDAMTGLRSELQRLSLLIGDAGLADNQDDAVRRRPPQPARLTVIRPSGDMDTHGLAPLVLAAHIRDLLRQEARRRGIGGGNVFGDPAWEMLLDLMLAKIEGRQVPVSSACIASGAPMSTALRLVGRLVDEGVLRKIPDETDKRRHFLIIDPQFEQPLIAYLAEQARQLGSPLET